ncbi:MAG: GNAT family N-acetyltransferase [Dehalococcoidia bacterium]
MNTNNALIQRDIKELNKNDVKRIVYIHLQSFKGFFLSFLGPSFLYNYYSCLLESESGIGLVFCKDDQILGFACGTTRPSDFYSELIRKKWLPLAISSIPACIRRPSISMRLAREVFSRPLKAGYAGKQAALLSICVLPEWEGNGFGKILLAGFINKIAGAGIDTLSLSTDQDSNDKVNKFYQNNGFTLACTYVTSEGRLMNEYVIHINL